MNRDENLSKKLAAIHKSIVDLLNREMDQLDRSGVARLFAIRVMVATTLQIIDDNPTMNELIKQYGRIVSEAQEEARASMKGKE